MKKIGIDLDDVLLNFNDPFLNFHNENFGTTYRREDITNFNVEEIWGIPTETLRDRLSQFYDTHHHESAPPIEGAVEAIKELSKNNKLYIITSSPQTAEGKIRIWLKKHFGEAFEEIHFTKKDISSERRNKGEMCRELGLELFIDDHPDNAEKISAIGIPVYLFDTPWNQGEVGPLVKRVRTWSEIVEDLNKGK